LSTRGAYSAVGGFQGDSCLAPSTASAPVSAFQKATLRVDDHFASCGQSIDLVAVLETTPAVAPVPLHFVHFDFDSRHFTDQTDATGEGRAQAIPFPLAGNFPLTVDHQSFASDFFTDHDGTLPPAAEVGSALVLVSATLTEMDTLTVNGQPNVQYIDAYVGDTFTVFTTLRRSSPASVIDNVAVTFELWDPFGGVNPVSVTTNSFGVASYTFVGALNSRNGWAVVAKFGGDACMSPIDSNFVSIIVYQKASLSLLPTSGECGVDVPVSATITLLPPGMTSFNGEQVQFSLGPNIVGYGVDGGGIATGTIVGPDAGVYQLYAEFAGYFDYFADSNGNVASSFADESVTISLATTHLAQPTVFPGQSVPSGTPVSFSTLLTRVGSGQPIDNIIVTFTLTNPTGTVHLTTTGTTVGTGVAFSGDLLVNQLGLWSVVASIGADPCLAGTSSVASTILVTQAQGVGHGDNSADAVNAGSSSSSTTHGLSTGAVVALAVVPTAVALLVAVYVWRRCAAAKRASAAPAHSAAAHTTARSKPTETPNPMTALSVTVDVPVSAVPAN